MPYLTNAEINELNCLKTTADEGILRSKVLWAAKGTKSSSTRYWGEEGVVGFGFKFGDFLSYSP
jgi:hypothetical protein